MLLQDTYDFDVQSAVAKGTIEYMDHENQIRILKSGVKLVKSDLIDLSKVSKEKNLYDKAIMFIMVIRIVKFSSGGCKIRNIFA